MEAHKEKREQIKKEEEMKRGTKSSNKENDETVMKRVICESIVSGGGGEGERVQTLDDVLAFSRTVRNVDSSLE
uniref:Uncharacterized protein n=1 Tax=Cajanus cajan TaxID=3821 RepID=A0A151RW36_CAJCA|nr:hypothetical protein KK1_031644 [Cajanus cajan]